MLLPQDSRGETRLREFLEDTISVAGVGDEQHHFGGALGNPQVIHDAVGFKVANNRILMRKEQMRSASRLESKPRSTWSRTVIGRSCLRKGRRIRTVVSGW